MLTKTLKFDNVVLDIIKAMIWSDDGKLATLTCGQLDRETYQRVNKALAAMGGKWNRKLGGHIFPIDPRPKVDGLILNGELTVKRDGFFETPEVVVSIMTSLVLPRGKVLEPSAGLGAIVDQLRVPKETVFCVEIDPQRAAVLASKGYETLCADFLVTKLSGFDTVFMNPPFEEGQEIDHVMHAFGCLAPGGEMVSVMSVGPFFRADRNATAFRQWFTDVGGTQFRLPANSFKESGTSVETCLVVLSRNYDAITE